MPKRKFAPILLESKNGESGAVSLAMLLGYFGSYPSLTDVKIACDSGNEEILPENLLNTAEEMGLEAKLLERSFDELNEAKLPLLIYGNNGRYFLLTRKIGKRYIIHDPEKGRQILSRDSLQKLYGGKMIKAEPGSHFQKIPGNASFFDHIWERLRPYRRGSGYVFTGGDHSPVACNYYSHLEQIVFR